MTGGPSQLPGLVPRLHATLRPLLPPEMPLRIVRAGDALGDAWRGMADFARTDEFARVSVSSPAGAPPVIVLPPPIVAPEPMSIGATSTQLEPTWTASPIVVRCLLAPS